MLAALLSGEDRTALTQRVTAPRRDGRALVAAVEAEVEADPQRAFCFDERGYATLLTRAGTWAAGRFETPSVAGLRARLPRGAGGRCRVCVLKGTGPLADVATLQAFDDGQTLFQVASQFNCLEAPSPRVVPVAQYFGDPTQGPRASISAFPGTLLRHHVANAAPVDLLRDVGGEVARVRSGYLTSEDVASPEAFAELLEQGGERVRVGVHDGVEVVLGQGWHGPVAAPAPRIAQVFTSTVAAGGYSRWIALDEPGPWRRIAGQLLRAAYLGTLFAAIAAGKKRVLLTMIGGGVFGNPAELIAQAVRSAVAEVESSGHAIEVVVNVYSGDGREFEGAPVVRA